MQPEQIKTELKRARHKERAHFLEAQTQKLWITGSMAHGASAGRLAGAPAV